MPSQRKAKPLGRKAPKPAVLSRKTRSQGKVEDIGIVAQYEQLDNAMRGKTRSDATVTVQNVPNSSSPLSSLDDEHSSSEGELPLLPGSSDKGHNATSKAPVRGEPHLKLTVSAPSASDSSSELSTLNSDELSSSEDEITSLPGRSLVFTIEDSGAIPATPRVESETSSLGDGGLSSPTPMPSRKRKLSPGTTNKYDFILQKRRKLEQSAVTEDDTGETTPMRDAKITVRDHADLGEKGHKAEEPIVISDDDTEVIKPAPEAGVTHRDIRSTSEESREAEDMVATNDNTEEDAAALDEEIKASAIRDAREARDTLDATIAEAEELYQMDALVPCSKRTHVHEERLANMDERVEEATKRMKEHNAKLRALFPQPAPWETQDEEEVDNGALFLVDNEQESSK